MTEATLLKMCEEPRRSRALHWTSEIYGFGKILRLYGLYPSFLPLNIYFSHGVTMHEVPARHELRTKAPVMLYFSDRLVFAFRSLSTKPCYCVLSPNVFFRRKYKIKQSPNAAGTLAFFAHTTPALDNLMDVSAYVAELKALPSECQPVTVCFHFHDVHKLLYKPFIEAGFEITTVGHQMHPDFIEKFYRLISNYRYLTSNEIGSYSFYGPEMGIPFFLYGSGPKFYNNNDRNVEMGDYTSFRKTNHYKKVSALFSKRVTAVTEEQKVFVESELGVGRSVSRLQLAAILYSTLLVYIVNGVFHRVRRLLGLKPKKRYDPPVN